MSAELCSQFMNPVQVMKNKASKRKKKESTPKRRSQGSKYPLPSAGKKSTRNRSNYPPSDAGDTAVGYEEEYYDVSNIDESMAYIGFKALAATKIVILLYSLISCFHLQVTGTGQSLRMLGPPRTLGPKTV